MGLQGAYLFHKNGRSFSLRRKAAAGSSRCKLPHHYANSVISIQDAPHDDREDAEPRRGTAPSSRGRLVLLNIFYVTQSSLIYVFVAAISAVPLCLHLDALMRRYVRVECPRQKQTVYGIW